MDSKGDRSGDDNERAGLVGDTLKKLFTAGVSAAFMTEESIRSFVSEVKLPKETLNLLLTGANKSKEELMNRVSKEIIGIVSKIDFVKEASRFVEEHKFRINAEIEVIRKDKVPERSPEGAAERTSKEAAEASGRTSFEAGATAGAGSSGASAVQSNQPTSSVEIKINPKT